MESPNKQRSAVQTIVMMIVIAAVVAFVAAGAQQLLLGKTNLAVTLAAVLVSVFGFARRHWS